MARRRAAAGSWVRRPRPVPPDPARRIRARTRTDAPDPGPATRLSLALVGADRPGIVAEISGLLADRGVSVEELATSVTEAPMAGTPVFEAQAVLVAPAGLDADDGSLDATRLDAPDRVRLDVDDADAWRRALALGVGPRAGRLALPG